MIPRLEFARALVERRGTTVYIYGRCCDGWPILWHRYGQALQEHGVRLADNRALRIAAVLVSAARPSAPATARA